METFDWPEALANGTRLAGSFILTAIIGWNRERESHNTGIRAFPIVGIASCAYMIITQDPKHFDQAANSRVLQGLVTGIGFVGAGAIVHEGVTPRGTATAAAVWCAGAIGASVAMNHWVTAVLLVVFTLIALRGLAPLKAKLDQQDRPIPPDS